MKPLRNLIIFTTLLLGIALASALLVAHGRNYSENAGGHAHGSKKVPKENEESEESKHTGRPATSEHGAHSQTPDTKRKEEKSNSENEEEAGKVRPTPANASIQNNTVEVSHTFKETHLTAATESLSISHIYHVGAKDFFLDQQALIVLSNEQQVALNHIKAKALAILENAGREMRDEEGELWKLTNSDQPDMALIEQKVRNVENLKCAQRLSFIRSVGDATSVLTAHQKIALLGARYAPVHAPTQQTSDHD